MFFALRDIVHAKGRFIMLVLVISTMTLLVGSLTSLALGLASQNVSAITSMKGVSIVVHIPDKSDATLTDSALSREDVDVALYTHPDSTPMGISTSVITFGSEKSPVAAFGDDSKRIPPGQVVLSQDSARTLGVDPGGQIMLRGQPHTVSSIEDTQWYAHMPVVWMSMDDWRSVSTGSGVGYATIIRMSKDANPPEGLKAYSTMSILPYIGAFRSEIGSLGTMIGMLVVISAAVTGMFFLVWTMQRSRDLAVLKALGAPTSVLVRDVMSQSALVIVLGVIVGTVASAALGVLLDGTSIPYASSMITTLIPAALLTITALAGSALSLRTVATSDPLTALSGA